MITELITRFFNKTTYFSNWQTAKTQCDSYDSDKILSTLVDAGLTVEKGGGMYERDGKVYKHYSENMPLTAAVKHVIQAKGSFQILDLGGALGNSYRQNRWFLPKTTDYIWCVVEQERFVETGKRLFENHKLKFETTIPTAIERYHPNIAVMSNALQRMEHPFDVLTELAKTDIPYLFIDRTPVISSPENRITRSGLPAVSDSTFYPTWVFSESEFKKKLQEHYRIINEFDMDSKREKKTENRRLGFFCEKI
jgi:putative methyltransferase (TIGR04325 family)